MLNGGIRTKNIKKIQGNIPLITVVTVVHNGGVTLEETILSVINQTYLNIEYIIVDGASTDGTLDIIRKYEERIDYWISEPDRGIYDAMNKGVKFATGEWINFMNSGDKYFENNVIVDIIEKLNNYDIIYGDYMVNDKKIYHSPQKIDKMFFLLERMICHQTLFERRSILLKYPFDIQYKIIADRKQLLECYLKCISISHIPHIICIYDIHGISSDKEIFKKESFELLYEYFGIFSLIIAQTKRIIGILYRSIAINRN